MTDILGDSPFVFLLLTFVLFGPLAYATGQAVASQWQPWPLAVFYCALLSAVERFTDYALAEGELLSPGGFVFGLVVLSAIGLFAWRFTLAGMMVRQYPWLYERAGPLSWRSRAPG